MQTLSEKAKGKQRADPIPGDALDLGGPIPPRELMVRFTEGVQDLLLHITELETVRDVRAKIREARPQLQRRRLRLVHAGRLLTDGTQLTSWLGTLEERQQRATSKDKGKGKGKDEPDTSILPSAPPWLNCSVGPQLADGEEDGEAQPQETQIKPLRGFDRLTAAGFSQDDIQNFRRQFHSRSAADYLATAEFPTEEEYEEHARALEEQWIDALGSGSGSTGGSTESNSRARAVLNGIIIGFFFPLLPFFFLRAPKPAAFWENGHALESPESTVFSRRMQMGLVVGFIMNVMFGTWRYLWGTF